LPELTEAMKKKGKGANWAYSNTTGQIMGRLYALAEGLEVVGVGYASAPDTLNDLTGGRIDYMMSDPQFAMAQSRQGRIRMLAVSTAERVNVVPDVPTMAESGTPEVQVMSWFALMVPGATPKPIVEKLNGWFNEILKEDETRAFVAKLGG